MRNWTDQQFRDAGWKYLLKYKGSVMACSVSCFDAANWEAEKVGEVVDLTLQT